MLNWGESFKSTSMSLINQVKALVFDAYGTLFDIHSLDEQLSHYYGEKANDLSIIWRRKQLEYTWLRSAMDRYQPFSVVTMEALEFATTHLGLELEEEIKEDLMARYFTLSAFAEVAECLKILSENNNLAVLSNANFEMLEGAIGFNRLEPYLHQVFSVDSIKIFKPDPRVYQLAVDGLKVPKQEIAFISGNTWDVAGAKSFGLKAIWLNRGGGTPEKLGFKHDLEISQIKDML